MDASPITLGREGQRRLYILNELAAGRLTIVEAAFALDVSIRHLKRLRARSRDEGIGASSTATAAGPPGTHSRATSPGGSRSSPTAATTER